MNNRQTLLSRQARHLPLKKGEALKMKLGQSLVEVVLAIGIVALIITGVVILLVNTIGVKNNSFDRKRASEMAEVVIENLIKLKKENAIKFWSLQNIGSTNLTGFEGFTYSVGFSLVNNIGNCTIGETRCANANIIINWNNGSKTMNSNRFFSKDN